MTINGGNIKINASDDVLNAAEGMTINNIYTLTASVMGLNKRGEMMNAVVLIPAFEPDEKLIKLVNDLTNFQFPFIMVVNDGSSTKSADVFSTIEKIPNCIVIHHEKNRGKGATLKTGIKAILNMDTNIDGCITVDADGQHLPQDIFKVAKVFEKNKQSLVLGSRDFSTESVPFRSKFGNKMTSIIYKLVSGKTVSDTQTGLRAIPMSVMERVEDIAGDRYEFEMNMLIQVGKSNIPIKEVAIQTVYIDENSASHFNPLVDSVRIYKQILKFGFSSLISSLIDIGLFTVVFWLFSAYQIPRPLLGATGIARIVSSTINFILNKKIVFRSKEAGLYPAVKYYSLSVIQMLLSWILLEGFTWLGLKHVVILKVIADTILFLISFIIQRVFVFERKIQL